MLIKKFNFFILIFIFIFCTSWGFLVHRTLHQIAIYSLPDSMQKFYFKNMKELVKISVDPDLRQKFDSTEKTKHFIDLDGPVYKNNLLPDSWDDAVKKFTEVKLRQEGTLPWEIIKTKNKLIDAFKNNDEAMILLYSADLGHYVADAFVPLHTTINYDGQLTNQVGLHGLWETECPQLFLEKYNLFQNQKVKYVKNVPKEIWQIIRQSNKLVKSVAIEETNIGNQMSIKEKYRYQTRNGMEERKYSAKFITSYNNKMSQQINGRLIGAAQMISNLWYTAWVDAKKPDLDKLNNFSQDDIENLKKELGAWRNNSLIENNLLRSKNGNN